MIHLNITVRSLDGKALSELLKDAVAAHVERIMKPGDDVAKLGLDSLFETTPESHYNRKYISTAGGGAVDAAEQEMANKGGPSEESGYPALRKRWRYSFSPRSGDVLGSGLWYNEGDEGKGTLILRTLESGSKQHHISGKNGNPLVFMWEGGPGNVEADHLNRQAGPYSWGQKGIDKFLFGGGFKQRAQDSLSGGKPRGWGSTMGVGYGYGKGKNRTSSPGYLGSSDPNLLKKMNKESRKLRKPSKWMSGQSPFVTFHVSHPGTIAYEMIVKTRDMVSPRVLDLLGQVGV
jgi:hypothetical protein